MCNKYVIYSSGKDDLFIIFFRVRLSYFCMSCSNNLSLIFFFLILSAHCLFNLVFYMCKLELK